MRLIYFNLYRKAGATHYSHIVAELVTQNPILIFIFAIRQLTLQEVKELRLQTIKTALLRHAHTSTPTHTHTHSLATC